MKPARTFAASFFAAFMVLAVFAGVARSQAIRFGSGSGGGGGGFAGGDVAAAVGFPAGTVSAPGWYWTADNDGTGTGGYRDSANSTSLAANGVLIASFGTGGNFLRTAATAAASVGTVGNEYFGVRVANAISTAVTVGDFGNVGSSDGKLIWTPRAATISNPTDSATVPTHGYINMSAGGAAAWTPSETGAESGSIFHATNSGANVITMTNSAGVYEKGPCAVGQYGTVVFGYFVDRFVQISCTP